MMPGMVAGKNPCLHVITVPGWWFFATPLKKYELVSWDDEISNIWWFPARHGDTAKWMVDFMENPMKRDDLGYPNRWNNKIDGPTDQAGFHVVSSSLEPLLRSVNSWRIQPGQRIITFHGHVDGFTIHYETIGADTHR